MNTEQAMRKSLDGTFRRIIYTGYGCAYETVTVNPKVHGAPAHYTPEEDQRLIAMLDEGLEYKDIAAVLTRTLDSVKGRAKRLCQTVVPRPPRRSREEYLEFHRQRRANIAEMYNAGVDIREIAAVHDLTERTLRSVFSELRKTGEIGYRAESHPKLTPDKMATIRRMHEEGHGSSVIAAAVGVSAVTIWKHTKRRRER